METLISPLSTTHIPAIQIPVPEFNDSAHKFHLDVLGHFDDCPEVRHRVVVWHRRSRKTTMGLNLLIRECVRTQNSTYAYIAPFFSQAKAIVWRDPMMLRRYLPEGVLKKPFNESELFGEFKSNCVLHIGGADYPDRWRGTGCYGWILDEFPKMRNGEMLFEEIILPIITENGGWVMFLYTPKGRNHGWKFFQRAGEQTSWKRWLLPVTQSGILTPEQIETARHSMSERLFAQEFMCEFLVGGGGVIQRVREAVSGSLERGVLGRRYVMGVDLGKREDWTVITVIDAQRRQVVGFERFQKIDWSLQKEKIARCAKEYNLPLIILDSTGLGDPIEDDLKRMGLSVRGFKFSSNTKKQLIEKLILSIEDRRITLPDIPELVQELEDFDIDEYGRYSAPEGLHDDCVISLALAVEGLGAEIYTGGENAKSGYVPITERFRFDT